MKKLATTLALIALLAPQAFADQLQWLDSQADAIDAASRIEPGMPYVHWISHMEDDSPRLLVAKSATVRKIPNEPYWEVVVDAAPVAELRGDTWAPVEGEAKSTGIDLAYIYLPASRQADGQQFNNVARSMRLEAIVDSDSILVPRGPMNLAVKTRDAQEQAPAKPEVAPQTDSDWSDDFEEWGDDDWDDTTPPVQEPKGDWSDDFEEWEDHDWDDTATAELPLSEEEIAQWDVSPIVWDVSSWFSGGDTFWDGFWTDDTPAQQGALGALQGLDSTSPQRTQLPSTEVTVEVKPAVKVDTTSQQRPTTPRFVDRPLGE
jgi:hypothetical protein